MPLPCLKHMTIPLRMMPERFATARILLICLLALAVLGLRVVGTHAAVPAQSGIVVSYHTEDPHGHSHEDAGEPSGHDHAGFHIGDHSHDTPAAGNWAGLRLSMINHSGKAAEAERIASRPTAPGDRPPRKV